MLRITGTALLILCALSTAASAAQGWFIRHAEIDRISVFSNGTFHGMHLYFRANPEHVDEAILGSMCARTWVEGLTQPTDTNVVTWRSSGQPGPKAQLMYSTALAAHAQGLNVDIWVDTGSCIDEPYRPWGYKWNGVSVAGH